MCQPYPHWNVEAYQVSWKILRGGPGYFGGKFFELAMLTQMSLVTAYFPFFISKLSVSCPVRGCLYITLLQCSPPLEEPYTWQMNQDRGQGLQEEIPSWEQVSRLQVNFSQFICLNVQEENEGEEGDEGERLLFDESGIREVGGTIYTYCFFCMFRKT